MKFRSLTVLLAVLASLGLGSCVSPEWVDKEQDGVAGESEYRFDILTLSEWAGNIMPTKAEVSFSLYKKNRIVYLLDSLKFKEQGDGDSKTIVYELVDNAEVEVRINKGDLGELIELSPHNLIDGIECSYEGKAEFDTNECNEKELSSATDINCLAKIVGIDEIFNYKCTYYRSGAVNLASTWELLRDDNGGVPITQIKVGNGDSFGVSQSPSAMFNDLPVPMMLNAVGFDVDTLGNHSFDRTLTYLQDVIDNSKMIENKDGKENNLGYHYVASNLTNTSKNLNDVISYALYKVPGTGAGDDFKVALIGVLGSEIMSSVFPGRFGSVDINNDPCEIANTIERAYNNNARAFFIMAHALTDSDSLPYLFQAIYSFKNPENINSESCPSVLEVPPERLEKVFGQRHLGMIDMNSENTKKYHELILKIRREIFDSIIGVIGEATSESKFVALNQADFEAFNRKFNTVGGIKPSFKDLLSNNNLIANNNDYQHNIWGSYTYLNNSNDSDEHKIYFIQYPETGYLTTRIQITATKEKNPDWESVNSAPRYFVDISRFDLVPVMSTNEDTAVEDSNGRKMLYSRPQPQVCKEFLQSYSNNTSHSLEECTVFYQSLKDKEILPNSLADLSSEQKVLFDLCYKQLYEFAKDSRIKIKNNKDKNPGSVDYVSLLSTAWLCLYNVTAMGVCDENGINEFRDVPVFKFLGYVDTNVKDNRSRSTYATNIMTESLLGYINSRIELANPDEVVDGALMNTGGLRDVPGGIQTLTKQVISEAVPYDNAIRSCIFQDVRKMVSIVQTAFKSAYEFSESDYGGFPSLARFVVSYDKSSNQVNELWMTDRFGLFTRPLYIKLKGNSPTYETFGVLGSYRLMEDGASENTKTHKLSVSGTSPNYYFDSKNIYSDTGYGNEFNYIRSTDFNNKTEIASDIEYVLDVDKEEIYYIKPISLLTNDFLVSGGDGYNFNDDSIVCTDPSLKYPSIDNNVKLKAALYNYFNGGSKIADVCTEDTADSNSAFVTVDGLSQDAMDCVLSLNHIFESQATSQSRWIQNYNYNRIDTLCTTEKINGLLEDLKKNN
ncbi:MAG: hypothetical protein IJU23_02780 [Proteobacteria bacterium]|nr:hypothetical protein [Pseudomonadota bacterium]